MEKKSSGQRGRIQEGQVRVPLEGELDLAGLSRDLRARGFFLANDPEAMDSQGWGEDYDPEGYYPYWVFRDGKRWVFACPPKDLFTGAGGAAGIRHRRPDRRSIAILAALCTKMVPLKRALQRQKANPSGAAEPYSRTTAVPEAVTISMFPPCPSTS